MVITICKKEFYVVLIINVLQIIYGGLGVPFPIFFASLFRTLLHQSIDNLNV